MIPFAALLSREISAAPTLSFGAPESSWEPERWNRFYSVAVKLFHWTDEVVFRVYVRLVLLSSTNISGVGLVKGFRGVSLGGVIDSGDDARWTEAPWPFLTGVDPVHFTKNDLRNTNLYVTIKREVRVVAIDLPTSHRLAAPADEFTGRVLGAINDLLLDILAATARKDYLDRHRRAAEGRAKAKAAGKYKGRPEDRRRNKRIEDELRKGTSWSDIAERVGCGRATVARVATRIRRELAA